MNNQISPNSTNTQIFFNALFNQPVVELKDAVQHDEEIKKLVIFNPEVARLPRLSEHESLVSWLLRASGVLDKEVIKDAFEISHLYGVDPFDVLTVTGMLSNLDLKLARQASQLVSTNLIYRGFAATAIAYASKNYTDLHTALVELDMSPDQPFKNHPLVILLEKSQIVPQRILLKARQEALSTGVTFGWVLLGKNVIGQNLLKTLLESLIAVHNKRISMDHVVSLLERSVKQNSLSDAETVICSHLETGTQERIFGNFLLGSGNLNLEDWLFCAEVAVLEQASLYQVCSELKVVKEDTLLGIYQLAEALASKEIQARQCTAMLEKYRKVAA